MLNFALREMIGDQLADAVDAARVRVGNDSISASCNAGLWLVEVDGDAVSEGLTYEQAVAAVAALEA